MSAAIEALKFAGPPIIGLLGGWLAGRYSARAALASWRRSREDLAAKQAVDLIQQLSTDLAGLSHCAMWLTWKAKFNPDHLQEKDLDRYEEDTYLKVPRLLGNLAALAAIDMETTDSLHPFVLEICKLDNDIAHATIDAREKKFEKLTALHETAWASYGNLLNTLNSSAARVLNQEGVS